MDIEKSRVIIKLGGGLGNQMFQYAAAKALALHRGSELYLDITSYHFPANDRSYSLHPFSLSAPLIHDSFELTPTFVNRIRRRVSNFCRRRYFEKKNFYFDEEFFNLSGEVYLYGYFQSEKYFEAYKKVIRSEFQLRSPPSHEAQRVIEKIRKYDSICIHIRRGDYVGNVAHGVLPQEYYSRGIELLSKDLKNPHCFVFSDEPQWAMENFQSKIPYSVIDINTPSEPYEDMRLMKECHHFIIANSSFSWWAAWLGVNSNKKVIAPKQWYQLEKFNDVQDLIPSDWILL